MVYQRTKSILHREGLAPKKKLGQNFLKHEYTAERIVDAAGVREDDIIIEVGVGLGALTRPLAKKACKVIGIEADSGIVRMHEEQKDLPENVHLRHGDILKTDLDALANETGGLLKIVTNLPYSISSPFLFYLIKHCHCLDSAVVMLQKEVALRLLASPGTKEYGVPTVLLNSCADIEALMELDPSEFHPQPKVDSQVVGVYFSPQPERVQKLGLFDRKLLTKIVNAAFGQRRKTLLNSVSTVFTQYNKKELGELIIKAGIDPGIRAEKLTIEDYVCLSRILQEN